MDKETITQYSWIIIVSIILATLIAFATPFGKDIGKSLVTLVKGQTQELNEAYSEDKIKENQNYMEQLFDTTHMQPAGLYAHNDASRYYGWEKLIDIDMFTITNGHITKTNDKEKLSGDLIIDDTIIGIDANTFKDCEELVLARMGFGIADVGSNAFANCYKLKTFISGINVREIQSYAFRNCKELKNVYLNEKITTLGANLFIGCAELETIYYDGTIAQWNAITKGDNSTGSAKQVICNDGTIEL